jgi:cyclic-di-GMP-binding protein
MNAVKQSPVSDIPTPRITAPRTELERLSFCETHPGALAEWVTGLPMANTADAAAQVRQATWEISRLQRDAAERMALLEQIRSTLHYLCARLDRNAGSSTIQGDAIARLAQRLQTNLCSGYKSVVVESLSAGAAAPASADRGVLPLAIHRALSDLSRTLLRTLQFYIEPAERLWLELNQLYLLAERLGVAGTPLEDAENHTCPLTSPMNAYLRSLLLACSKPNQMRHRQLAEVFNCLEEWSQLVTLEPDATSSLFAVDLESDQGPAYKRLLRDTVEPRGIRTDVLVYQLESYVRDLPCTIRVPDTMNTTQVTHLAEAWGVMRPRSHRRQRAAGEIVVCVGLRSAHYFLSGGVEFNETLNDPDAVGDEVNPFLLDQEQRQQHRPGSSEDVWDDAFDLGARIPENPAIEDSERILSAPRGSRAPAKNQSSYEIFQTSAIDTSPSGYQICWLDPLPPTVQPGEIVGLRETADSRWCIAVIRWIRQNPDGTAMGIELLSPRATPVAVRAVQKVGGPSSYSRGLLLPDLALIGQLPTLITPRVPFQAGQKVHIQRQGVRSTAQLLQCVLKTESVNQFTYRMLAGYLESARATLKMSDQ